MSRNCLIIGGSGGLGQVIAAELARRGDRVGLMARSPERLAETESKLTAAGGTARGFVADVLRRETVETAVASYLDWAGGLDALIFAAGRFQAIGPIAEIDSDEWRLDLETSVVGALNGVKACLPALRNSSIPSISILVGAGHQRSLAFASGYCSGQAALVRLVEGLDLELAESGIVTYAVFPGLTPCGMTQTLLDQPAGRKWLPSITEAFAEGKEVDPEVVASMLAWLTESRPKELSGRVVFALMTPELLELRLSRIEAEDRHRLRLT